MRAVGGAFRSFGFGLSMPLRSVIVIGRNPVLIVAGFVPWVLSVILDTWLVHRLQTSLTVWIGEISWVHAYGAIEWTARALVWITALIAGILSFSLIAGIAALPFNDWLAELTEPRATPPLPAVTDLTLGRRVRLLAIDLLKAIFAIGLSLCALVLTLIPMINVIGAVLTFLLLAFQFVSYPQTRRGDGIGAGLRFLARNFWACLGFGMSFAFLFALPLMSTLALPLAVVGGTLLYARAANIAR